MAITEKKLLEQANRHLSYAMTYFSEMHTEIDSARSFAYGDQWPAEAKRIYRQQKRMMLTIDRITPRIENLIGVQRETRPRITVKGIGHVSADEKDQVGRSSYSTAQVIEGMIKGIEVASDAGAIYDAGYEAALQGGLGAWRILTQYEDDGFNQCIKLERIPDAKSFLIDPDSVGYCTSRPARFGIILSEMSDELYEDKYNVKPSIESSSVWRITNGQRVIEYFWIDEVEKERWLLSDKRVVDAHPEIEDELNDEGIVIVKSRKVFVKQCMWSTMIESEIIQKPQEFPSKFIPIIPVFGRELVDPTGKLVYRGLIHRAKDAQRMYNFARTSSAETLSLQPKSPFIIEERQITGYNNVWATANTEMHNFLPYKYVDNVPPPRREPPLQANEAAVVESQQAEDDINATSGVNRAKIGQNPADASGKAVDAKTEETFGTTYLYYDNLLKALKRTGVILKDMIPKVYDTERVVTIIGTDDTLDYVKLHEPLMDSDSKQEVQLTNWAAMSYQIDISTAPANTTRKRQMTETLLALITTAPQLWNIVGDILFKNMELPDADALSERMRKMLPPEVTGEKQPMTDEQIKELVMQSVQQYGLDIDRFKAETDRTSKEEKTEIEKLKVMVQAMNTKGIDNGQIKTMIAEGIADFIEGAEQAQKQGNTAAT